MTPAGIPSAPFFWVPFGSARSSAGDRPPGRCAQLLSCLDPATALSSLVPIVLASSCFVADVNLNVVIYVLSLVSFHPSQPHTV